MNPFKGRLWSFHWLYSMHLTTVELLTLINFLLKVINNVSIQRLHIPMSLFYIQSSKENGQFQIEQILNSATCSIYKSNEKCFSPFSRYFNHVHLPKWNFLPCDVHIQRNDIIIRWYSCFLSFFSIFDPLHISIYSCVKITFSLTTCKYNSVWLHVL